MLYVGVLLELIHLFLVTLGFVYCDEEFQTYIYYHDSREDRLHNVDLWYKQQLQMEANNQCVHDNSEEVEQSSYDVPHNNVT